MASPPPSAPAGAAGLEGLEGLVLHTVITKAGARPAAALSCASTRLRAAVAEDAIWRRFCAEDFGLDAPLDPEDGPLPSFKDAYKVWLESFGMYPLPLVKRVKNFWSSLKSWLSENFPEALKTLSKGVSEAQIKSAEDNLGFVTRWTLALGDSKILTLMERMTLGDGAIFLVYFSHNVIPT